MLGAHSTDQSLSQVPALQVLLVEDNPGDAELIRERLEEVPGSACSVKHVSRLASALRCLKAEHIDVLLLDLGLPDSNGVESVRRARAASSGLPIVVLTGADDADLGARCVQFGAQDYLLKREASSDVLRRALALALSVRQRDRIDELERQVTAYRAIVHPSMPPIAGQAHGPVAVLTPTDFACLVPQYGDLLDAYLEQGARPDPTQRMRLVADQLGALGAGSRDVIALHLHCLELALRTSGGGRERAYTVEGRLLALEVMGLLADYYRRRCIASSAVATSSEDES